MRDVKAKFDDLVDGLSRGEKVSFGQMEELFAFAFLSRFLQRLSSEKERKRAASSRAEGEDGDCGQQDEEPEYDSESRIRYEIDVARTLIGTLGVRPSVSDLAPYTHFAVEQRDWALLADVLSLTKEGEADKGVIQKVALDDIADGNDAAHQELIEHFGELSFTPELVREKYAERLQRGDFHSVGRLREFSHVEVPQELCQPEYERMLEHAPSLPELANAVLNMYNSVGVRPALTESVRQHVERVFALPRSGHVSQDMIGSVDSILGISADPDLSIGLQEMGLVKSSRERYDIPDRVLHYFYTNSQHKLSAERIKEEYAAIEQADNLYLLMNLAFLTKVSPSPDVCVKIYDSYIREGKFDRISEFAQIACVPPRFSDETVASMLDRARKSYLDGTRSMIDTLALAGVSVPEDVFKEYAKNVLAYSRDGRSKSADLCGWLGKSGVSESSVASVAVFAILYGFEKDFESKRLAGSTGNLLQPIKGLTLSDYISFKSYINAAVKNCSREVAEARGKVMIQDDPSVQDVYKKCLELLLVECEQGSPLVPIKRLVDATGVPVLQESINDALVDHICTNAKNLDKAETILEKASYSGIPIAVDASARDDIMKKMLARIVAGQHAPELHERLEYIVRMAGSSEFSPEVREAMRVKALGELRQCRFDQYDHMLGMNESPFTFTDTEIASFRQLITGALNDPQSPHRALEVYDSLQARVPAPLLDAAALRGIAVDSLSKLSFGWYDSLKQKFNFDLELDDEEKDKLSFLLLQNLPRVNRDFVATIDDFVKRAGFKVTATPAQLHELITHYFNRERRNNHPKDVADALGCELDPQQVQDRYVELVKEDGWGYYVTELFKNTGIPLSAETARVITNRMNYGNRIGRLVELKEICGYVPPVVELNVLFSRCIENDDGRAISVLCGRLGYKPSSEVVRRDIIEGDKSIEDKLRLLSAVKRSGYSVSREDIDALFNQAAGSNSDVLRIMRNTSACPPDDFARRLVDGALDGNDWDRRSVVEILVSGHGYSLSQENVDRHVAEVDSVRSASAMVSLLRGAYKYALPIAADSQKRIVDMIDRTISRTDSRKGLYSFFGDLHDTKVLAREIVDPALCELRDAHASELLGSGQFYKAMIYSSLTGAAPSLSPEQLASAEQALEQQSSRLRKWEQHRFKEVIDSWKRPG